MDEKIPAGTMVKVGKQEGTVVSHGEGVVHVDIGGEIVSLDDSKVEIVGGDKKKAATSPSGSFPGTADPANPAQDEDSAEMTSMVFLRLAAMANRIGELESRIMKLEEHAASVDGQGDAFVKLFRELDDRVVVLETKTVNVIPPAPMADSA